MLLYAARCTRFPPIRKARLRAAFLLLSILFQHRAKGEAGS